MRMISGFSETLTAKHDDPTLGEGVHEHTWTVTLFYRSYPFRDGRALKAGLRIFLDALVIDGELPRELWSGEALAERLLMLEGVVGARVTRPEGYLAEVWR